MREVCTPMAGEPPTSGNLTDHVVANAFLRPDMVSFSRRRDGDWLDVTAADFFHDVQVVARGLIAAGVEPGDRVALLSRTRYEWTLVDYAIWFAGGVSVPIYGTSSDEQIRWIISDSGAKAVVVETTTQLTRVESLLGSLPGALGVWCLEDSGLDTLRELGSAVPSDVVDRRRQELPPAAPATIIYTSGTTGTAKGCALTHANFMVEVDAAVEALPELFEAEDTSTLLFLPLAHVFARVIQVGAVRAGVKLGFSPSAETLLRDLQAFQPTFILGVPRVFEKVFTTASQEFAAEGRGRLFDAAADTAIAYSRALDRRTPGLFLRARHSAFERMVYAKLRETLGGRCTLAISGGAPLGDRLAHFYRGIGVTVLEGYGLAETTAALTVNLPQLHKIGSVGRPLPGACVRVTDEGELLVRGGQVFASYWNDPTATAEALDPDGWLRTGDLGEIDDEGFVRITGRKKEVIVTAGGKSVAPSALEEKVRAHPLVSQCLVVGDGQPYLSALVTIDRESFALWADQRGKPDDVAGLLHDPALRSEIAAAIEAANQAVSKAESIRRFEILPGEWTEENGALTPSLKLKRHVVLRECADRIDDLYSDSTSSPQRSG